MFKLDAFGGEAGIVLRVGVRHHPAELGVRWPAVVTLPEVLGDDLPVGTDDLRRAAGDAGPVELMRAEEAIDILCGGAELGRLFGEAEEDQPRDHANIERVQAEVAGGDAFREMPGVGEVATEEIAPVVVGADKPFDVTFRVETDPRPAMPTDVVEASNFTRVFANEDERIVPDLAGEVVTRLSQSTGRAGE